MKEKVEKMKRSEVDENNLKQLLFTDKEYSTLIFHDDGNELEFDGKMYDVVKIKKINGKNGIWCLTDTKETQLKIFAKKQQQEKNLRFRNLLLKVYISSNKIALLPALPHKKNGYLVSIFLDQICSPSYDILKPPPQAA